MPVGRTRGASLKEAGTRKMHELPIKLAEQPDKETLAAARGLFSTRCEFLKGVVNVADLPAGDRVEVCFAGRSNVGKSSLINALVNRKGLARMSKTPGRTREINFFTLGASHHLVDLPGYGYAKMPKTVAEKCQQLMRQYLRGRSSLRRAFLLLDSRRRPKQNDEEFMKLLDEAAVSFQIVLTKTDKVGGSSRLDIVSLLKSTLDAHPAALPEVIATSAHSGEGIGNLRAAVSTLL